MKKNMKGITLVSLVITIIVMLILAGVSIQMATGDNGVLNRGQQGAVKTKLAGILEELNNAVLSLETDFRSQYIEESSLQARKADYFTVGTVGNISATSNYIGNHKGINDYLTSCKILTGSAKNSANDITVSGADNSKVIAVLAGMNTSATNKKDYTSGTSTSTKCGYNLYALYLSNDKTSSKIGGDLYVALYYMEKAVPTFVDVGIIEATGSFTQGTIPATSVKGISWLYQSEYKNN